MANLTVQDWIKMMAAERDQNVLRAERLLFDIASFILKRAKNYAKDNFGRGIGNTARTAGRSGALMRSIQMARVSAGHIVVEAGGPGVPYAAVQELGTIGKGGQLPSIVPKPPRQWLTIPLMAQYVGRRATEFKNLRFVPYSERGAALVNASGQRAYLLVKRTDIQPRPYLAPAAADAAADTTLGARIKVIYGSSQLPFEVVRV